MRTNKALALLLTPCMLAFMTLPAFAADVRGSMGEAGAQRAEYVVRNEYAIYTGSDVLFIEAANSCLWI